MLIKNIGLLAGIDEEHFESRRGAEMNQLGVITDAWLRIDDEGRFAGWGQMADGLAELDETIDAMGGAVLPSFCDSHTHLVYAGSREHELAYKNQGLSYEEIAQRGGGILNSAERLHNTSENDLYCQAAECAEEVMRKGTGLIEIKSGYGLNLADELKMLRVIARLAENSPMEIRATFLGAHAVGPAYAGRQAEYVDHVIRDMIPAVAAEGLAEFVDVFCDRSFFTPEETARIIEAGAAHGMRAKIHGNELAASGGVQTAIAGGALSVDHLERIGKREIKQLATHDTIATMLPGASFFLDMPFAPARAAIDAGAIVALASDYNPGSSPSGDMRMVMSLGCIRMKMTTAEAINATTINGAAAMGLGSQYGSIAPGKIANCFITRPIPSLDFIPYAYTTPLIDRIILAGNEI